MCACVKLCVEEKSERVLQPLPYLACISNKESHRSLIINVPYMYFLQGLLAQAVFSSIVNFVDFSFSFLFFSHLEKKCDQTQHS